MTPHPAHEAERGERTLVAAVGLWYNDSTAGVGAQCQRCYQLVPDGSGRDNFDILTVVDLTALASIHECTA